VDQKEYGKIVVYKRGCGVVGVSGKAKVWKKHLFQSYLNLGFAKDVQATFNTPLLCSLICSR